MGREGKEIVSIAVRGATSRPVNVNVHEERSRLDADSLARWRGMPMGWFDAAEHLYARGVTFNTPVLALLEAGTARANFGFARREQALDIGAGAMGLFIPDLPVRTSEWQCVDARRVIVHVDLAPLARRGLVDDDLVCRPLRDDLEFYDADLAAVLRAMVREVEEGCPNGTLFAESLSLGIALRLCRTHAQANRASAPERGKLTPAQRLRVEEFIAAHLDADILLAGLAEAAGFSKPHFVRLFRNTVGTSPHQYVLKRRVEEARRLVQGSHLALAEIASTTGFASQSHLHRVFVRTYGITPGEARRQLAPKGAQPS